MQSRTKFGCLGKQPQNIVPVRIYINYICMYIYVYFILESNLRVMDCDLSKLHVKVKKCGSMHIKSLQISAN